jgi:hypothetical protein
MICQLETMKGMICQLEGGCEGDRTKLDAME